MPPQITGASALPGKTGKHKNHIFHSSGLIYMHIAPVRWFLKEQQGQHPLTGQRAPPISGGT